MTEEEKQEDLTPLQFDLIKQSQQMMKEVRKHKYKTLSMFDKINTFKGRYPTLYSDFLQIFRAILFQQITAKDLPTLEVLVKQREKIVNKEADIQEVTNTVTKFFYDKYEKK